MTEKPTDVDPQVRAAEATVRPESAAREASLRLESLRAEIALLEQKRDELKEDSANLERQVELELSKLDSVHQSVQRTIEKKLKIRDEIAALRAEETAEIAKHTKALDAITEEQQARRAAFRKQLETEHEDLAGRVQQLQADAERFDAMRRRRERDYERVETRLDKLRAELGILDDGVRERRKQLEELEAKLVAETAKLEAVQRKRAKKDG